MRDITIRVVTDSSGVDAGMTQAQGKVKGGMDKLMSVTGIGYAAMGAAAIGFAKQSISAAIDAEKAQSQLEDAYKRFHKTLKDTTLADLEDLADAQAKRSRYDDDAVKAGIAIAAQYGLTGAELEKLMPLIVDYAAKTGQDVPEAAKAIGLALTGTTRGLKGVGADLKLTGDHATDYGLITEALGAKVRNFAEQDLTTAEGKLADMNAKWGDFQEAVGAPMLGILTDLADGFSPLIEKLGTATQAYSDFAQSVRDAEGPLHDFGSFLTGSVFTWLEILWSKLAEAPAQLGGFATWVTDAIGPLRSFVDWIGDTVHALGRLWDKLKSLGSFGGIGNLVGDLTPWAMPPPSSAPAIAAGTSAARVGAATSSATGGRQLNVNVNIHGNVGDPAQVGKRIVGALEAFIRTGGNRRVAALVTP